MSSAQTRQMQALLDAKKNKTYDTGGKQKLTPFVSNKPNTSNLKSFDVNKYATDGKASGAAAITAPGAITTGAGANLTKPSPTILGTGSNPGYTPTPLGNTKAAPSTGGGYTPPRNTGGGGSPSPQAPQASQQSTDSSTTLIGGQEVPQDQPQLETNVGSGGGGGSVGQSVSQIRNDYASASVQDQATMAAMMEGMLSYIDKMGGDLTAQIRGQMGMDDPETANAIAMIRREAEGFHKEMLEDLNSKGLVQSGIYAEAKSRLAESQGMNVSNFVAQRFGDLQSQLNSAMMNIGQMRTGAMSSGMGMVNQNLMADRSTQAQLGMQGLSAELTARGQDMQQNQWGQTFDWQKSTDTRNFGYQQATDTRNFDYTQQRDAVGDKQFGQSLSASRASSGAGNSLGWAQFGAQQDASKRYDQQYAYDAGNQFVASYGSPKTPQEYQSTLAMLDANPMFQDPATKDYIVSQIVKPQVAQPMSRTQPSQMAGASRFFVPGRR